MTSSEPAPQREGSPEPTTNESKPDVDWGARVVGIALVLGLLLPVRGRHELQMLWESPVDGAFLASAFALALIFVIASFSRESIRRVGVALAGLGIAARLAWAVADGTGIAHDLRRLTIASVVVGALGYFLAIGAERAMHRAPKSRSLTVAAAIGWACWVSAFFVPLAAAGDFDSSMAGRVLYSGDREPVQALLVLLPALLGVLGLLQCLRRLGADRELASARFFKSPWLARILLPIPLGLAIPVAFFVEGLNGGHAAIVIFGVTAAIALGVQATLELAERIPRVWLLRSGLALIVVGAAITFFPRLASSGGARELAEEIGQEVDGVLHGESPSDQFLGGYSEFDLRGTQVDLPSNATLEAVLLRVLYVNDDPAWVVVRDGEAGWTCGGYRRASGTQQTSWSDSLAASYEARDDLGHEVRAALADPAWLPRDACSDVTRQPRWSTLRSRARVREAVVDRAVFAYRVGSELRWYSSPLGNIREHLWIGAVRECPDGRCEIINDLLH